MHSEVKVPISVIVPTRNEERNIRQCLESVKWVDEIFVVDSKSTDRTIEIAKEYTDNVVTFHWNGKWPKKKNWALEKLPFSHEWVLFLDADEQVTPGLAGEIRQLVFNGSEFSGFLVEYDFYFLGKLLKHGVLLLKYVFFKHRLGRFEKIDIPEVTDCDVEIDEHPVIKGKVGKLKNKMIHHDFKDLHHFFHRHNIFSDWEAHLRSYETKRNKEKEIKASLFGSQVERRRFLKELFFKLPGRPLIYFLYSYVIRGGFLDGKAGYIYNVLKAFYYFSVDIKLYEERLRLEKVGRQFHEKTINVRDWI